MDFSDQHRIWLPRSNVQAGFNIRVPQLWMLGYCSTTPDLNQANFQASDLRPLAALLRTARRSPEWFTPIGWDGPAFAATLMQGHRTLRSLGASLLKGTELCRALEPHLHQGCLR